jgi:hypothetical protein
MGKVPREPLKADKRNPEVTRDTVATGRVDVALSIKDPDAESSTRRVSEAMVGGGKKARGSEISGLATPGSTAKLTRQDIILAVSVGRDTKVLSNEEIAAWRKVLPHAAREIAASKGPEDGRRWWGEDVTQIGWRNLYHTVFRLGPQLAASPELRPQHDAAAVLLLDVTRAMAERQQASATELGDLVDIENRLSQTLDKAKNIDASSSPEAREARRLAISMTEAVEGAITAQAKSELALTQAALAKGDPSFAKETELHYLLARAAEPGSELAPFAAEAKVAYTQVLTNGVRDYIRRVNGWIGELERGETPSAELRSLRVYAELAVEAAATHAKVAAYLDPALAPALKEADIIAAARGQRLLGMLAATAAQ